MRVPGVLMRGGTSKGLVLHAGALPAGARECEAMILAMFGSPDRRQVDGLGGADPLSSKLAIVSPSERAEADVDYLFGQVGIEQPTVDYTVTCGNLAAAVAQFAVDEGLVPAREPCATVRIFNRNTGKLILAEVPVRDGRACTAGDCVIDGVPGRGAAIRLTFFEPAGGVTGRLLPTGQAMDTLPGAFGPMRLSVVDAGNLYAFVPAAYFGLRGDETPAELEACAGLLAQADAIRRRVAALLVHLGAVRPGLGAQLAFSCKLALLGDARASEPEISARILNPGRVHKAFAVTGAIALACAARVPGSVAHLPRLAVEAPGTLRIAHPAGVMEVAVSATGAGPIPHIQGVSVLRTARRLMEGHILVREDALQPAPAAYGARPGAGVSLPGQGVWS
ncbi:PrpF domain-containing protein [Alkalilimnicola sp. S0819]|uniref:PrpF domain-containing protein n=1 Tax=Alkalilimnicola sp. S0819 TaxID=2613922 RepID=UPI00186AA6D8|nr:PrpF domain-containing protein [Alkalilimnicola sp. S0819]